MSTDAIIKFEEAAASRFNLSTTEELQFYLTDAGEALQRGDTQDKLRSRCLALVGLSGSPDIAGPTLRAKKHRSADEEVVPGYRLDPNGIWKGRRWRIKIPRPEGAKLAKADCFAWNGKAPYWVPYDEVVSVPEPILNIMRDSARPMPRAAETEGTQGEIGTVWEFSGYNVHIMGVDPLTKDLAGSTTEWYQWKAPSWFRKRNTRELQTICGRLDIDTQAGPQGNRRSKSDDEMVGDILLFLFSDANAQDAATEK